MWHSDVAPGLIYSVIAPLVLVFSSITFGLLWVVFRYNLLYVTISRPDTRGLLYPTALTQLFTGIYVMELCMIGLLLLVRDTDNRVACVGQAVVTMIATLMTVGFHLLLNDTIIPLLRFLPHKGIDPCSKHYGTREMTPPLKLALQYLKRLEPAKDSVSLDETFSDMPHGKENLASDSLAFQHGSLGIQEPVIWIPNDQLGISDDELSRVRQQYEKLKTSNEHATLNESGKITITQDACDLADLAKL